MITISKGEKILGYDAIGFRNCLRSYSLGRQYQKDFDRLNITTEKHIIDLYKTFFDGGYIIEGQYGLKLTEKGAELCRAKCVKRINRKKADELLNGVIERIKNINNSNEFIYQVKGLYVFGSYIKGSNDLGDIDIAIELEFKDKNSTTDEIFKANIDKYNELNKKGSWYDSLIFGKEQVKVEVKNRSPYIHLIDKEDFQYMKCEFEEIKI